MKMRQGDKQHLHGVDLVDLGAVDDGHKVAVQDGNGGGNREESGNENCCAEHVNAIKLSQFRHHALKPTQIALLALATRYSCSVQCNDCDGERAEREREGEQPSVVEEFSSWNPRARLPARSVLYTTAKQFRVKSGSQGGPPPRAQFTSCVCFWFFFSFKVHALKTSKPQQQQQLTHVTCDHHSEPRLYHQVGTTPMCMTHRESLS
jgi:hypothetical protein